MSHKVNFREYGHGPTLILLHGYGGSVSQWGEVVTRLEGEYRIVVPNLSHLFLSKDKLLFPVIVEVMAAWIRENFPGERVHLTGMSFGGAVAWGLAARHPELVERLVMINPLVPHPVAQMRLPEMRHFFVVPMDPRMVVRLFESPIGHSFLVKAAEIFRPDRDSASRSLARLTGRKLEFVAELVAHFAWILRNEDWAYWQRELEKVKASSFVIWSQDDLLFTEDSYQFFASHIRAEATWCFERGGHILSQSEPAALAERLREFLKTVRAA